MDLKEMLGEELFAKVIAKLNGKKVMLDDNNFIPLAEVNKKIAKVETEKDAEITTLTDQLTNTSDSLTKLKDEFKDNEAVMDQLQALKDKNTEISTELTNVKFNTKLDKLLSEAGARNPKAVKPFLDITKENIFETLEADLKALKETDEYLFTTKKVVGRDENKIKDNNDGDVISNPFKSDTRSLTRQGQLIKKEPEKARGLIKSAGFDPADYGL